MAPPFKNGDNMIVVVSSDEVYDERSIVQGAQGRRGEQRPLEAVGRPFPGRPEGRTRPRAVVVIEPVEEPLDAMRGPSFLKYFIARS
jgi:hypothetical protein